MSVELWTPAELAAEAKRQGGARKYAQIRSDWVDSAVRSVLAAGNVHIEVEHICKLYDEIQRQCPIPEMVMPGRGG